MSFILRPYQQRAVDAVIKHITTRLDPCLVDAAPAAGKSFMVGAIAHYVFQKSGKHVLCLAPSATLVRQNIEKFRLTGEPASIFSASAGSKSLRHPVVFGTPGTVKNSISRFVGKVAMVVIDECHGITPTIMSIVDHLREGNPNLRVVGLSGTPYRMGSGYVYATLPDDNPVPQGSTIDPYFSKMVYRVSAQEMLDEGFLTPMVVGAPLTESYDTSGVDLANPETIDRAFVGLGRKTASIVDDVLIQSSSRKGGVMFFASTVQHAREIYASLPPEKSGIVYGEDDEDIARYKRHEIRYIVSVGKLTTGFDAPWTEVIALLRKTSSAALLQQILGRSWRLHPGKETSLLLDYANNMEEHFPEGDIYSPVISVRGGGSSNGTLHIHCPSCGCTNEFSARKNDEGYQIDEEGYFLDLDGNRIETEYGPIPAHYGRRCFGVVSVGGGNVERCDHRWTSKECPHCHEPNDIAAKYCHACKGEIIDPNKVLQIEYRALRRNPFERQTEYVRECTWRDTVTTRGNETIRVDFKTDNRSFSIWVPKDPRSPKQQAMADMWGRLGGEKPVTVTYQKDASSGFYTVYSFWNEPEVEPEYREIK